MPGATRDVGMVLRRKISGGPYPQGTQEARPYGEKPMFFRRGEPGTGTDKRAAEGITTRGKRAAIQALPGPCGDKPRFSVGALHEAPAVSPRLLKPGI